VQLSADPVRLAQVFSNLFDNAAKYTPGKGTIVVRVQPDDAFVLVEVRDNGMGISSDKLPHVFDLFYQAERSHGNLHGGLGIGLTLVRRLVEMHGGTVEAASDGAGAGSTFRVRLPIVAEPSTPTPTPASERRFAPRRLLVADDNRDSADSMALLLKAWGNQVEVAYDGHEALATAERVRPEVMLLDIGMPRLDGYEVARRLRAEPWGRDILLIAATGWGQDDDRQRSEEAGFDAHVVKPVDLDALRHLIERVAADRARTRSAPDSQVFEQRP